VGHDEALLISCKEISNAAYYSSANDNIIMSNIQQFDTPEDYYSILFHEIGHSTGHETRLNRKLGNLFLSAQ